MTPPAGSATYLAWAYSGGTVVLNTDFRNFTWSPSLNFIDSTAGADTFKEFIAGVGEPGDFSVEMIYQGTANNSITTYLAQGTPGSVIYGPDGTAAGHVKYTIPAISKGLQWAAPYADVITITGAWQQSAQHAQGTF